MPSLIKKTDLDQGAMIKSLKMKKKKKKEPKGVEKFSSKKVCTYISVIFYLLQICITKSTVKVQMDTFTAKNFLVAALLNENKGNYVTCQKPLQNTLLLGVGRNQNRVHSVLSFRRTSERKINNCVSICFMFVCEECQMGVLEASL